MASIQTYDIPTGYKGDTFSGLQFQVIRNGTPKNLTNTGIKIEFRRNSKTGYLQKTVEVGSGITKTDPTNGIFTIDAFLIDFPAITFYYDIEFNDSGVVKTYVKGTWKIEQDVTENV